MKQKKSGMVSVIVPVYNTKEYLRRCVESLQQQSYQNLEIILIDDGSTDGSDLLCEEIQSEDERIHVIHQKNTGQGLARNAGITIAEGEYIAFLDSDDYMESKSYEIIIENMMNTGADLCAFGYVQQDAEEKVLTHAKVMTHTYNGNEIRTEFVLHFFGDSMQDDNLRGVSSCMSVYRADIIEKNDISFHSEREVFSEDTLFNLDYCKHIQKVITLSDTFYHYCVKANSFTKGYQRKRLDLTVKFCEILKKYASEYGIDVEVANRIRMVLWISVMDCIKQEILRPEIQKSEVLHNIRKLICKNEVQENVNNLYTNGMGGKQKMLLKAIRRQNAYIVFLLGYIKVRTEKI